MFKFLTKITADDYNMLINDTPESRKKVVLLANALFIPVLLWFFSAYAMSTGLFGSSRLVGVFIGLVAAFFIFLVDRSIILAKGNNWIAFFRIVMGLCIATIGSIMVDECIFHEDINQQLSANKEAIIKADQLNISNSYLATLQASDSTLRSKALIWNEGINDVKKEADGNGGSKQRGSGAITNLKLNLSTLQQADYNQAKAEHDSILLIKSNALQSAENKINASHGNAMLLHRIEALFDLVFKNTIVALIYIIFTIFIFCLEFVVILFKMNSAETNYEKKLRMIEIMGSNRIDKIVNRDQACFDGGIAHTQAKDARKELSKNPPAFFN